MSAIDKLERLISNPCPMRLLTVKVISKLGLGNYSFRIMAGAVDRPEYGYCVYEAALLAKRLGYKEISVLEFGVAGGQGLLSLEKHSETIHKQLNIGITMYGFDTGEGLPEPEDYRDLPYHWKKGFYRMDQEKLRNRLKYAKVVFGNVKKTVSAFFGEYNPPPVGAVSFDLDFYSSTVDALRIFENDEKHFLPRVFCYFDDITGNNIALYNDYTGVRLAIKEFNEAHADKKLTKAHYLLARRVVQPWYHRIRIMHHFTHSRYSDFVSEKNQQLPID